MSLRLTYLKVEQLRRFRQPFELAQLQPGLNLFTAPNEAGKSTLVRAIRAAFFERYRSKSVDDLRPWGDSGATPSVEIGFELDGQVGLLSKSFLGNKARCDLRIGGQTWTGADAEEHLAQMLGFAYAGKGASKSEHWGIPGLLWVEQGSGQDLKEAADHAYGHLHQALESHLRASHASALTATGGDAVLAAVNEQRDLLLTSTGRPRGPYAEAIARVEALRERCQELEDKVLTYQQQVDDLSRLRAEQQRDEADRPWDGLQAQLTEAREALQVAEQAGQQLSDARRLLANFQHQNDLLVQQRNNFAQLERDGVQRQKDADLARTRLQDALAQLAQAQQQAQQAHGALTAAQTQLRTAEQAAQRQQLRKQHELQRQNVDQVQSTVLQAKAAEGRLHALRQQVQGASLSAADMQRLRQLEAKAHQADLRMQDLATLIQFQLLPGQAITVHAQGQAQNISGEGELLLPGATTLTLPGLGELTILPGGEDLSELSLQLQSAQAALRAALQDLDVPDLVAAEQRAVQQAQHAQQLQLAEQALVLIAPLGLSALEAQLVQLQAALQHSAQALLRLQVDANGGQGSGEKEADASADAPSLALAEGAYKSAELAQAQASEALSAAQNLRATASAHAEGAERECLIIQQQLESADRARQKEDVQAQLLAVQTQQEAQRLRVEQLDAQLAQARPDILAQDVDRFERSLAQSRHLQHHRATQITVLEQGLALQGAQGSEETLALSRGELTRAQRRQAELQLRANALELLRSKLEAKRQAALDRLQAPLQQHLQRYLSLLFPGASVAVSDTLVPTELTRRNPSGGQEVGAFDALSFGAREQLSLVSRFAYADLLREAGRPTLIILDDALVHSDAARLALMKRVVFDASQRHQILLFSCHPESWRDMGEAPRELIA